MSWSIVGVPSTNRNPGTSAEILFNQGESSAPVGDRYAIYFGVKSSAGTATVNVVYEIGDEATARTLGGVGSPAHRALKMHLRANPNGRLFAVFYAATSGSTNAPATATFTASGTITAAGNAIISVCEEDISFTWTATDTASTVGDIIEARINALTHLPVTASNSAGTVTLTTKVDGTSQNGIYRIRVKELTAGTGLAIATSAETLGSGAEGTTTEAANLTAALAVINSQRYYYIGITSPLQAHVALLKTHVVNKSLPKPGLRSEGFAGAVGTLSATQTIAIAQNYERLRIVWQKDSDWDPASIAANAMAVFQKREQEQARYNFDIYSEPDWYITKAYDAADRPSDTDLDDAITDGITPIASNETRSWIVFSATTRSKDSTGALDDWRSLESHRISVMDLVTDTIITNDRQTFKNFALTDNPLNADGTVNLTAIAQLPPRTLTPYTYKKWFLNQLQSFFDDGSLQRQAEWEAQTDVRIDPLNTGRLQVRSSGRTIDLKHQVTVRFSETTPN